MSERRPMVRVRDLTKIYRVGGVNVAALSQVSLDVPQGQFLSVVGPSGSGKSTLLHLMAGLDLPDGGSVQVDGHELSTLSDDALTLFRRRHVGVVFQFFNLLPTLTAEENVALPLLLDGVPAREVRARVGRALERVKLARRRQHRPDELSGGEAQRVALARAIVIEPSLLLADEPTGNLDSKTGREILDLIRETAEQLGQTVVMVTHDEGAAGYGSRLLTLRDGRIQHDVVRDWMAAVPASAMPRAASE